MLEKVNQFYKHENLGFDTIYQYSLILRSHSPYFTTLFGTQYTKYSLLPNTNANPTFVIALIERRLSTLR